MPLHDWKCRLCGAVEERFVTVAKLHEVQKHLCHGVPERTDAYGVMEIYYRTTPMGFVQRDICYDSPIDGRPITSKQARIEDLRRNDCVEYDPEMRKDAARRRKEADVELDRSVEATVDEMVATMPTRKLEKLEQEIRAGASVDVVRSTPDASALT
jgi:hypothetical protein